MSQHLHQPLSNIRPKWRRPRGIALLVTMTVLLLLTTFITEYFFSSGMELRSMGTYRDTIQARAMARSVLKVLEVGLMEDEVEFFEGYAQVEAMLMVLSQPLLNGLLIELKVEPLDHRYNLNGFFNLRPGEDVDKGRWNLFYNIMSRLEVPPSPEELAIDQDAAGEPLTTEQISAMYAALFDWVDSDEENYNMFPGAIGAEGGAYLANEPAYEVKNGMLDRLKEIRLIRGVVESGLPWEDWQRNFTSAPKKQESNFYFYEHININTANREEILEFLENRHMDPAQIEGAGNGPNQVGVNLYVDRAEELADFFTTSDEETGRKRYTKAGLTTALKNLGFVNPNYGTNFLFSVVNEYYKVTIVTEVNAIQAKLEAKLQVPRNENTRIGSEVKLLWMEVQ